MSTPLFICLDLQRAFLTDGPLLAPHAGDALVHCRRLLKGARDQRWSVAHCYLHRCEGAFAIEGERARPVEGFEPQAHEMVFERSSLSAYGHEGFEALMERSGLQILIAGLSASVTWVATAVDAFDRSHHFAFVPEALAAQAGPEASAHEHEAVARDIAANLGFSATPMPRRPVSHTPRISTDREQP